MYNAEFKVNHWLVSFLHCISYNRYIDLKKISYFSFYLFFHMIHMCKLYISTLNFEKKAYSFLYHLKLIYLVFLLILNLHSIFNFKVI